MISDSERREIAARLRELADANEGHLGMDRVNRVLRDGKAILGTSGLASVADVLRRYADLIEPEPEITCNAEKIPYMPGCYEGYWCSVCHCIEFESDKPNYCPNCGAKVVGD